MKNLSLFFILSAAFALNPSSSFAASTDLQWDEIEQAFASIDAELEETIFEADAILAEANVTESPKREERVMKRLDRRFDRQFKRFARRVNRVLKKHSDEELRAIFKTHGIRHGALVGDALEKDDAYSIATEENGGFIGIRAALQGLTSVEYREGLRAKLHEQITEAGGAVAYLKANRKALSLFRSINGCLWKEINVRYVLPVASAASLLYGFFHLTIFAPILGFEMGTPQLIAFIGGGLLFGASLGMNFEISNSYSSHNALLNCSFQGR